MRFQSALELMELFNKEVSLDGYKHWTNDQKREFVQEIAGFARAELVEEMPPLETTNVSPVDADVFVSDRNEQPTSTDSDDSATDV